VKTVNNRLKTARKPYQNGGKAWRVAVGGGSVSAAASGYTSSASASASGAVLAAASQEATQPSFGVSGIENLANSAFGSGGDNVGAAAIGPLAGGPTMDREENTATVDGQSVLQDPNSSEIVISRQFLGNIGDSATATYNIVSTANVTGGGPAFEGSQFLYYAQLTATSEAIADVDGLSRPVSVNDPSADITNTSPLLISVIPNLAQPFVRLSGAGQPSNMQTPSQEALRISDYVLSMDSAIPKAIIDDVSDRLTTSDANDIDSIADTDTSSLAKIFGALSHPW